METPALFEGTQPRARQGGNGLESVAYTLVREHFEVVCNAVSRRMSAFKRLDFFFDPGGFTGPPA